MVPMTHSCSCFVSDCWHGILLLIKLVLLLLFLVVVIIVIILFT